MPTWPLLICFSSIIAACVSIYHIFMLMIGSLKLPKDITHHTISEPSLFLIFDYSFWFWTILAWLSTYLLIKNIIRLETYFNRYIHPAENME